ncbi:MAG: histone deacetylase family protein [Frankiaceae bacterium]|nr:histone deacetylase family protein [Arenimonas sp.]
MRVYTHPDCLLHDPGAGHPESPSRLAAVLQALHEAHPALQWVQAPLARTGQLARVHSEDMISLVLETPVDGSVRLDADTVLSPGSASAALHACGAGIAAVDAVLGGKIDRAFCAVRPPGHHATANTSMGFCLFNSIAVAAAHALAEHGLDRVAIVDFDVHHGNGTQDIFQDNARVFYASSHQWPLYPGTGASDETGVGNVANAPLPPGAGSTVFRAAWRDRLLPALEAFAPQLLLVSAGFDGHRLDPLADLGLVADDYHWLTSQLVSVASRHARGRIVSFLEGGYSLTALRECSVAHVAALTA